VSDFGRLRSYDRFLIPVHALVWNAVTAGGSYSASLVAAVISTLGRWGGLVFAWRFTTERQPVLRPAVAFSKISFKHRYIQIKGNFTKLTLHLYFKCIMYYVGLFVTFIVSNRYLLFWVSNGHNSVTVQKSDTCLYEHCSSQRPRKSPPAVMP